MKTWAKQKLGDILTLQRGFDITKSQQKPGNYSVISSSGFQSTNSEYKVNGPGVVIGRKGTLGKVFYSNENFWPHDTTLWVKDFHGNDPKFAYYFFKIQHFENFDAGAANPTLNRNHLHTLLVNYPLLADQEAISSILSSYDELIENNEKRINLLEEVAQRLYIEWFVKFKFPRHEKVKIVDDTPEKWDKKRLGDFIEIKKGRNITKDTSVAGNVPVIAGGINPAYYHNTPNVHGPVVTISASGANAGYLNLYFMDIWASDCSYISKDSTRYLFFCYLLLSNNIQQINNLQKGAAQPHVYPKDLMDLKVTIPSNELLSKFEEKVTPIFELVNNLKKNNLILASIRDLLIPQLITGKRDIKVL